MLIMAHMHQVLRLANVSEDFEAQRSNEPTDTEPDRPRAGFSTFLLLQPFSTAPQTLLTPSHGIILLLLRDCILALL